MMAALSVVFFVCTVGGAGCNVSVGTLNAWGFLSWGGASAPAETSTSAPTEVTPSAAPIDPGELAREIVKNLPTPSPTATPSPSPTPAPGERLREGVWFRPRMAEDQASGSMIAEGARVRVKLSGKKKAPLVMAPRSEPPDKWFGVGLLGLVPEQDWLAVTVDGEGRFWFFGTKAVVIITEEAILTE